MLRLWVGVLVVCCALTTVGAQPVQWRVVDGGNGHYYEFVHHIELLWTTARANAEARTFMGHNGYLATVTSAGENSFLAAHWPERGGTAQNGWLGGYQDMNAPDYSEPAGAWRWVTGEPWVYANWHLLSGQPDNSGGREEYVRSNVDWQWDDFPNNPINPSSQYISGYFVEYTVPEPGMMVMAGGAALLLLRRRWLTS